MDIQKNVDLQPFNTLSVPSKVEYFCVARTLSDINEAIAWCRTHTQSIQILSGGSNVILAEHIEGLILKPEIMGKEVISLCESKVRLRFGAGENWHQVVVWCLQQGFYGLENLALIPGSIGAAPVQNIGAYGVEISRFIYSVECMNLETGDIFELLGDECEFAYRESIFKKELKGRVVITHVSLCLFTIFELQQQLYPVLKEALGKSGDYQPQDIFDAVCRIRQSKLPEPKSIPNCGSFFKNPVVDWSKYEKLLAIYPQMPSYSTGLEGDGNVGTSRKLAAAWLIDQLGWKGAVRYGVGVHDRQALVLTNPNHCLSSEVLKLAEDIRDSVFTMFDISLEIEPQQMC